MNRAEVVAVLVSVALTCDCGQAQPAIPGNPPIPDRELLIATKEAPPFAMKQQDGTWRGISIDLWRRIAERLHLRYRFFGAGDGAEPGRRCPDASWPSAG